jgi:predicted metal-binding membrane protein
MIERQTANGHPAGTANGRDRATILAVLAGLTGISWLYLVDLAADMGGGMSGAMGASLSSWSAYHFLLMFVMWWVMMIGMMAPSAAPMILTFATINRRRRERDQPFVPTALFAAGYLAAWGAFSIVAVVLQWGLEEAALLSPMMVLTSPLLGGLLFVAAGIYQWTPLKHACLKNCRSPLSFIITRWRDGRRGALLMGVEHGAYCLGCCWFIMALLFVGGVMNLLWVAFIAAVVFVEKLFPAGERVARTAGVLMFVAGVYMLLHV